MQEVAKEIVELNWSVRGFNEYFKRKCFSRIRIICIIILFGLILISRNILIYYSDVYDISKYLLPV